MGTGCKSIKMGISTCSSQEGEPFYWGIVWYFLLCTWGIVWYCCVHGGLYGIAVYMGDCMVWLLMVIRWLFDGYLMVIDVCRYIPSVQRTTPLPLEGPV